MASDKQVLETETARRLMLRAAALDGTDCGRGLAGVGRVLERLGEVQLDPIDRVGTNADLVFHARVDGVGRGMWSRTMPGGAFEHFAKERCLLPARRFPAWREHAAQAPWWRLTERLKRLDDGVIQGVLNELRERGPCTSAELSDHGAVRPLDWSGWLGTAKAATMALEVLWTRCQVVTAGRRSGQRVYDLPERAIPEVCDAPGDDFFRSGLDHRLGAIGLLRTAGGPQWSALSRWRQGPELQAMIDAGELLRAGLPGSRRTWLVRPADLARARAEPVESDDRVRILGPLDPLLWDRELVRLAFGFDYVWEVYKPAAQRRWGYYVCPLLWRGRLVGRLEGRRDGDGVVVDQLWWEDDAPRPPARRLRQAVERLGAMNSRR